METKSKIITVNLDLEDEIIQDQFTLAMSSDSRGVFTIGEDIEKFSGILESDVIERVLLGDDKPTSAVIYGLCNIMNGGRDIYLWTNFGRLKGRCDEVGEWKAIMELVSHEVVHLSRKILTRHFAKKDGSNIYNTEWIYRDYGSGPGFWPAIGEEIPSTCIRIEEEVFATVLGLLCEEVIEPILDMYREFKNEETNGI